MYIQSSIFTLWCQIVWYKIVLVPNCPRPRNNWIHQKSPTFTTEDQRYPPTNQLLPPIWLIVTVCTGLGACKIGRYNYNALSIEIKFALYLQKKRHIICVFFSGKNLKFTHQYLHFDKCFFSQTIQSQFPPTILAYFQKVHRTLLTVTVIVTVTVSFEVPKWNGIVLTYIEYHKQIRQNVQC